ncbi:MAG: hypothetical protein EHM61_24550 [Acidobacteria bacterium]|nr:MAG: hypothetical protein EHM61_24550 [Acidobacteriota bacterium]
MKNQYVGDINDYRKYGLLRALTGNGKLRLGICWMLTPDDQKADGSRTTYLQRSPQYRRFDPELFDRLATWVGSGTRGIDFVEGSGLLPGALFHSELIPDDGLGRRTFFDAAFKTVAEAELVFFDPDNGFEIDSCRPGQKGSNRYLCWNEAQSCFDRGQSVIVYQHFARENRELHTQRLAGPSVVFERCLLTSSGHSSSSAPVPGTRMYPSGWSPALDSGS